jgi:predicted RNA binding protein YcfA (HicA-like mRNA interferase family)
MARLVKLLEVILQGTSDANIPFGELCSLLKKLGFKERIRGDHHIFTKDGVQEIVNIQPKGSQAKVYQVKQIRSILLKYKLGGYNFDSV